MPAPPKRRRSTISGGAKLRRLLQRLPPELTAEVVDAVQAGAEIIKKEQTIRAPAHDTDLVTSIEIKKGSKGLSAEVGPGARTKRMHKLAGWRSHWTEFGTRPHSTAKGAVLGGGTKNRREKKQGGSMHPGQPAKPFIFPGLAAAAPQVKKIIDEAVNDVLRRFTTGSSGGGEPL